MQWESTIKNCSIPALAYYQHILHRTRLGLNSAALIKEIYICTSSCKIVISKSFTAEPSNCHLTTSLRLSTYLLVHPPALTSKIASRLVGFSCLPSQIRSRLNCSAFPMLIVIRCDYLLNCDAHPYITSFHLSYSQWKSVM